MNFKDGIEKMQSFIEDNGLFEKGDHLLLAVSGGVDSMVMLALLSEMPFKLSVIHFNFQLRGIESDLDAEFVKEQSDRFGAEYLASKVDTRRLQAEEGKSIQEVARNVRYAVMSDWVERIDARCICTAHHLDDSVETLFINLIRGTGIAGLTGIPLTRTPDIVRPMLCFRRSEIEALARSGNIPYREDSSNQTDDYLRNRVRHHVIPALLEADARSIENVIGNIERISREFNALKEMARSSLEQYKKRRGPNTFIDLDKLNVLHDPAFALHQLVQEFHFNRTQCEDILQSKTIGAKVVNPGFEMIRERRELLIRPAFRDLGADFSTSLRHGLNATPFGLIHIEKTGPVDSFSSDPNVEFFSSEWLDKDLEVRLWKAGDSIQPLGMSGSKNISDILTDQKVGVLERDEQLVVTSGDTVLWAVGRKLSRLAVVEDGAKSALRLSWRPLT